MKNNNYGVSSNSAPKPQAWVAVSNNRQKIYGINEDLVYLDNDQEFQIELYNPTNLSYLAKIYLNDKLMSNSGLVIKPGQRYFLDRYLDEKKKILFSTYDVDDNKEVKEAIKSNGKVKVEFYPEHTNYSWSPISAGTTYVPLQTWTTQYPPNTIIFGSGLGFGTTTTTTGTTNTYFSGSNSAFTTTSAISGNSVSFGGNTVNALYSSTTPVSKSIETGRVEKGGKSNQKFGTDSGSYSWFCSYTSEYQIMPRSGKPVEVTEIRSYCPGCGTRMKKKTWKFCPDCGESLD
jgi:hypothetical protein